MAVFEVLSVGSVLSSASLGVDASLAPATSVEGMTLTEVVAAVMVRQPLQVADPPRSETVTFRAPRDAVALTVTLAVITPEVVLTTVALTPAPEILILSGVRKLLPSITSELLIAPWGNCPGVTEVIVGNMTVSVTAVPVLETI